MEYLKAAEKTKKTSVEQNSPVSSDQVREPNSRQQERDSLFLSSFEKNSLPENITDIMPLGKQHASAGNLMLRGQGRGHNYEQQDNNLSFFGASIALLCVAYVVKRLCGSSARRNFTTGCFAKEKDDKEIGV